MTMKKSFAEQAASIVGGSPVVANGGERQIVLHNDKIHM
jgi:hypothetical protein